MKEIELTQGQMALIDDEDWPYVQSYSWYAHKSRSKWYAAAYIDKKRTFMHRLLTKVAEGVEVDHIDGNGLNNCRKNLRQASHQENGFNKGKHKNNTSGYIGVQWHPKLGRWRALIRKSGKSHSLGCFVDKKDAAKAYNEAAIRLFGEYAKLNVL